MMKLIKMLTLGLLWLTAMEAQQPQFSGYYEHQFFLQFQSGEYQVQDYNKLRIDVSSDISENMTFNADYVFQIYDGINRLDGRDFFPAQLVGQFQKERKLPEAAMDFYFTIPINDRYYLDNAYVSLYQDRFTFSLGKQQIAVGSGYAWNPTDMLNIKNQLDPTYEKEGINAAIGSYRFSDEGEVSIILSLQKGRSEPVRGIKIKEHVFGFDLSIMHMQKVESHWETRTLQTETTQRRLSGIDLSGQLFGLGVWAEGAYNSFDQRNDYAQIVGGTDYTFENGLYFMAEYYRNGLGKTSRFDYDLGDWTRLLSSAGENLGRDYLYSGIMYPVHDLWNASNYVIFNFSDGSGMILPWLDYSVNDNTQLSLIGYLPYGKSKSEFGGFGGGGIFRLRAYF